MAYVIKPLTPALAIQFADYLSGVDFSETPHWASCFCRFYHTTCSTQEWMERTLEQNRSEAMREIAAGNKHGYLAFENDACVGWCNACDIGNLPRLADENEQYCRGKRVGCTICFLIHPEHRGRGLARQILSRAVEDFRAAGYDAMIALPVESPGAEKRRYRGTLHMYEEAGYRTLEVDDRLHVMWLDLKR
jgi:GNAT superfamily N-acetyltransferase